jgi:hypothetical protein
VRMRVSPCDSISWHGTSTQTKVRVNALRAILLRSRKGWGMAPDGEPLLAAEVSVMMAQT